MEKIEIIKDTDLSGPACSIYSVKVDDCADTLFDEFIDKYYDDYTEEIQNIYDRLKVIGRELGMREQFFKPNEGSPGDGVCAFYDIPESNLRLYFISYGKDLIILGDGGPKPKSIRTWQESTQLTTAVNELRQISSLIAKATREKVIRITQGGFDGEMILHTDEY